MASINGISVKKLTKFLGHEGEECFQGNLYLGNKKIGFWSQDSWGGPDNIIMDSGYSEKLLNEAIIKLNPDKALNGGKDGGTFVLNYDLEFVMYDLLCLHEYEKIFKKAFSEGYRGVLIATDGFHQSIWKLPNKYADLSDEELFESMHEQIQEVKKSFFQNSPERHSVKVYRSFDDFNIGEPISPFDIMLKKALNKMISDADKSKKTSNKEVNKDIEREI